MRVLHIVPLIDEGRTYGGPVSVSDAQCAALARRGHDVVQIACGRRSAPPSTSVQVERKLFPYRAAWALGRWTLCSPALIRWVSRHAREFDVVHVHLARDLTMLPAACVAERAGVPVVTQTHGMVGGGGGVRRYIDGLVSARVLRRARLQLVLTAREKRDIVALIGERETVRVLGNGVETVDTPTPPTPPTDTVTFGYVGRLTARKRPDHFVLAAHALLERGSSARFLIAGPDADMGGAVRRLVGSLDVTGRVQILGALRHEEVLGLLGRVDVLVLPSVEEPFPMVVLEAMARGRPVIITTSCGLADAVERSAAGAVIAPVLEELIDAMDRLAGDAALRRELGVHAQELVEARFSLDVVVDILFALYEEIVMAPRDPKS